MDGILRLQNSSQYIVESGEEERKVLAPVVQATIVNNQLIYYNTNNK